LPYPALVKAISVSTITCDYSIYTEAGTLSFMAGALFLALFKVERRLKKN
jgi:hypothetical protein